MELSSRPRSQNPLQLFMSSQCILKFRIMPIHKCLIQGPHGACHQRQFLLSRFPLPLNVLDLVTVEVPHLKLHSLGVPARAETSAPRAGQADLTCFTSNGPEKQGLIKGGLGQRKRMSSVEGSALQGTERGLVTTMRLGMSDVMVLTMMLVLGSRSFAIGNWSCRRDCTATASLWTN
jgi:hypothetical protein